MNYFTKLIMFSHNLLQKKNLSKLIIIFYAMNGFSMQEVQTNMTKALTHTAAKKRVSKRRAVRETVKPRHTSNITALWCREV